MNLTRVYKSRSPGPLDRTLNQQEEAIYGLDRINLMNWMAYFTIIFT